MAGTRERLRLIFLPFGSGAADAFRDRRVSTLKHARGTSATATDPTVIKSGSERGTWTPHVMIRGVPTPAPHSRHVYIEFPRRIAISLSCPSQHGCRIKRTRGLEETP